MPRSSTSAPAADGPLDHRRRHRGRGDAHVAPDRDPPRLELLDVGAADRVGALLVELGGVEPAHVVRLEDLRVEHALDSTDRRGCGTGPSPETPTGRIMKGMHDRARRRCGALAASRAAAAATASDTLAGLHLHGASSTPSTGGGYPVSGGLERARSGNVRAGELQLQLLGVVARRSSRAPRTSSALRSSSWTGTRRSTTSTSARSRSSAASRSRRTRSRATTARRSAPRQMPPSWTNDTDPTSRSTRKAAPTARTLPFDAYWANLHPNSEITVSYSDDLGPALDDGQRRAAARAVAEQHLDHVRPCRGQAVDRRQQLAAQHDTRDHVYATWTVFNGDGPSKIKVAVSRDRGQTFSKAGDAAPTPKYSTPANDLRAAVDRLPTGRSTSRSSAGTTRTTRTASAPST